MMAYVYKFTVFTPTYNRAHLLPRVYKSLQRQTFRDFEWLIVDDGSTDNTRDVVTKWQEENLIPIRYYWQDHAHKKAAFNRGVREAKGELFLPLDSDDEILPEAIEILYQHWRNIPEDERHLFSGETGLCVYPSGRLVGSQYPKDVLDSNSLEVFYRYRVRGDKFGFIRTDVLRMFPFPEEVQGHVPEGVVWSAIAQSYKTRFVNAVLLRVYRSQDSLTASGRYLDAVRRNSEGHALWAREVVCNEWRYFIYSPLWLLKMAANYTRFHHHLKYIRPGRCWPLRGFVPRLLVAVMWPVGLLVYLLDLRKAKMAQRFY